MAGELEVREVIIRVRGADQAAGAFREISADADKSEKQIEQVGTAAKRTGSQIEQGLGNRASGALKGLATAAAAAGAAMAGMFVKSGFDALLAEERGTAALTAVMKDAQLAQAEVIKLRELAKLPGIDFTGAIQLSAQLQAVGMTADEAREALEVLSNGVVASGGDFASLQEVVRSVSSAIARGVLEAEDLKELRGRIFSIGTYFQQTGVTSAKAWAEAAGGAKNAYMNLFDWMGANIPKVSGGLSVQLENLKIAAVEVAKGFAKGLVGGGSLDDIEGFTDSVGKLAANAEQLGKSIATLLPGMKTVAKLFVSAAYSVQMLSYWATFAPGGAGKNERAMIQENLRQLEAMHLQLSVPDVRSGRLPQGAIDAADAARQQALAAGASPAEAAAAARQAAEAQGAALGNRAASAIGATADAMDRRMQRETRRLATEAG